MREPDTDFKQNHTLYSKDFDDIYFSVEDGLAESEFVFLKGNNLLDGWPSHKNIRICETGFGTGLNFLATAKLFQQRAQKDQKLFYTAIEKHPLDKEKIKQSLSHWQSHFPETLDSLLDNYPMRINGFHPIMISKNIFLVLIFEDVIDALKELETVQDYWFLDGFSPAQNPDMWQDEMFTSIQKLSHHETKLATFTAAGKVKRALENNQFEVRKIDGFGRKREMITARSVNDIKRVTDISHNIIINIAGAGLSGLSTGWLLKELGLEIKIFEKNAAANLNASSNQWGIVNPRIGASRIPAFDYFNNAFSLFTRQHKKRMQNIGALHIAKDEEKKKRFEQFITQMKWPANHVHQQQEGIFFQDAGISSPKDLCAFYAKDLDITYDCSTLNEQIDIYATSFSTNDISNHSANFPLQKIRGQVSYAKVKDDKKIITLNHVISSGSYVAPIEDNRICFGATFQHWVDHLDITEDDHHYNLEKLIEIVPSFKGKIDIYDGWTGYRCASKDRMPIIGSIGIQSYNIAHGSHGMISSLAGAYILAYQLGVFPQPFSKTVLEAVSPQRYDKI